MKFIHMADMHFDAPFVALANEKEFATKRRLEQRRVMKEIIEYIKNEKVDYLFIAGDLYEQQYIKKTTIEYINNLFKEISNTKIFITPGNHDPYINNSFYKQYKWNENVHIFKSKLEKIEEPNIDIYGYGFEDFHMPNLYKNIEIDNKNKINILITHGSLDGANDENMQYNPMTSKDLKELGFNYVALGHIHKNNIKDNQTIIYPGSTVSLGFDELGDRGFILGEIDLSGKINTQFIKTSAKTFEEKNIDVSNINSQEDLIELINNTNFNDNKFYKVILIGQKNFSINTNEILKMITIENIIKITDKRKIKYEIDKVAEEINLKGLFAKKIKNQIEQEENNAEKEKLMSAFELGMDILNSKG